MKRRDFMGLISLTTLSACLPGSHRSSKDLKKNIPTSYNPVSGHFFPALPFEYNALEPYIDERTMELHYAKHHRKYFQNFCTAIDGTILETTSMRHIFESISSYDEAIRNNGGGYYNHLLFWDNLSADGGQPSARLLNRLIKYFNSFGAFQAQFNEAAKTLLGSGWVWLILTPEKELQITATSNQDNPLMDIALHKGIPLLTLDAWEHAYYLKYKNLRSEYIANFWKIINWKNVNKRFEKAMKREWLG